MMLHLCQDNQVTSLDVCVAPTIGNQVDALARIACKDNLFALACIHKARNFYAGLFHGGGCLFADLIHAAMNVSVVGLVIDIHGIDDSTRLL